MHSTWVCARYHNPNTGFVDSVEAVRNELAGNTLVELLEGNKKDAMRYKSMQGC